MIQFAAALAVTTVMSLPAAVVVDDAVTVDVASEVDGVVLDETWDTLPPWGFTGAKFPEGVFTIRAVAEDPWQNRGFSEPIELYVGVDAPVTPAEDSGAGEDDGGTSGTSAGGDAASEGRLAVALAPHEPHRADRDQRAFDECAFLRRVERGIVVGVRGVGPLGPLRAATQARGGAGSRGR